MSEYKFYVVEKKPPIAWVYLNRPEKKNAMNQPAWKESIPIFEDLDRDPDIRAVVISGKGETGKTSMAASLIDLSGRVVAADWDVDAFLAVRIDGIRYNLGLATDMD